MPLRQVGRIVCDYIIHYSIAVQVYFIIFAGSKSYIMPVMRAKAIVRIDHQKITSEQAYRMPTMRLG